MLEISPDAFCMGRPTTCMKPVSSSSGVPFSVNGTMLFCASSLRVLDFGSTDTAMRPSADLRMTNVISTLGFIIWFID